MPKLLTVRLAVVLAAAAMAFFAGAAAFASAFARTNPALAAEQPIAHGNALATLARALLAMSIDPEELQRLASFPSKVPEPAVLAARSAFQREPLSADAILVLAFDANAEGDRTRSEVLFGSLNQLNKRSQLAALWLAQEALQRGDVEGTLRHFDELLRTTSSGRENMLRQFAAATPDPGFRNGMAELLLSNPPWAREFWQVAPEVAGAAKGLGELRLRVADSGFAFDPVSDRALGLQLMSTRNYDTAVALYRKLAERDRDLAGEFVRNWQFERPSKLPPVDWDAYASGDFGSEIRPDQGVLIFSAINSGGGVVAREWVQLSPGRYRLAAQLSADFGGGGNGKVLARLTCMFGQRWREFELENGKTGAAFTIPSGLCREFWLDVVAIPGEGSTGLDGELDYLSIRYESAGDA